MPNNFYVIPRFYVQDLKIFSRAQRITDTNIGFLQLNNLLLKALRLKENLSKKNVKYWSTHGK